MVNKVAWGCLKSLTHGYDDILLYESIERVGRRYNVTLKQNQCLSNKHFCISRIEDSDENYVKVDDLSSNGTFINEEKCNGTILKHFDEICLLKPRLEKSVHFMYIDFQTDALEKRRSGPQCDYYIGKYLGSGGFAIVREVIEKQSKKRFAMKIISINSTKKVSMIQNEINVMQCLDHENIIKLFKVYITDCYIYLILEHLNGGALFHNVDDKSMTTERKKSIAKQILEAISYLKQHQIIHRDVKPENILFDSPKKDKIKLTDFGLSRKINEEMFTASTLCGSELFIAPEIIEKNSLGETYDCSKVDVWSTGVILFILTCGYSPFETIDGCYSVKRFGEPIHFKKDWEYYDPLLKDLINHMLDVSIDERYSVEQCLSHPYFK
ncbi:non-specific serine/threonine protein kinase [Entamoeba marina]